MKAQVIVEACLPDLAEILAFGEGSKGKETDQKKYSCLGFWMYELSYMPFGQLFVNVISHSGRYLGIQ